MCFNKFTCLLLLLTIANFVAAQDANSNTLDSFTANLITAIHTNAGERAYIVADKAVYKQGEYIWFNTFLLNTASQKWSSKSRFVFVDIVDSKDSIIKRLILDAADKQLYSRMHLPDSLPSGYYWLRAYTKQMAQYNANSIGVQPLYILGNTNPRNSKPAAKNGNTAGPTISFYPEGGNIITGMEGTVGIVASDEDGMPLSIEGIIKDNKNKTIDTFTTNANGLGRFAFEANGHRQYTATVNYAGKEWSYPLPAFDFYKGQLAIKKQPGQYQLTVLLGDSIYKKETSTYVFAISKDSLVFAAIGKGQYQVNVDENKFPAGITTFYLFDAAFKMLSERSLYVNNNTLQVNITADKKSYSKRDKVNINLSVTDAANRPVPALISIAATDSVFTQKQSCNLTDVAAIGFADNLFFATHNCFSDDEKDMLMLTRSNTYNMLTAPASPAMDIANDTLLYIKGKVLNGKNEGAHKLVTLISSAGSNGLFYFDTTDNSGHFRFALDSYPDSMKYALQVKDFTNHVLSNDLLPDTLHLPQLKTPAALKQLFAAAPKPAIDRLARQYNLDWTNEANHLPPVTIKDAKANYDVSKRVSTNSFIISGNDLDARTSVDNVILRTPGLQLVNGFLVMRGLFSMSGAGSGTEPLLLVDGVQVSAVANSSLGVASPVLSYLSTLNPRDIDFIEVLNGGDAANFGVRGANGVIIVNSANKSQPFNAFGRDMKVFYATGVTRPALFPVSMYNEKNKKSAVPDVRSTLFWNGQYLTGHNATSPFTFYTSDVPATYTFTVTGITVYGDVIFKTFNIESK